MEARPRSTWMSVVGRVPVAVSCSEKLTLSLENGEKASVVLKGAALGKESDVRAAVTVERCHPDRWKGREGMAAVIRVKISVPWGIKEREFFTEDGQPADVSKFYEAFNGSYGQYYWLQNILDEHGKQGAVPDGRQLCGRLAGGDGARVLQGGHGRHPGARGEEKKEEEE